MSTACEHFDLQIHEAASRYYGLPIDELEDEHVGAARAAFVMWWQQNGWRFVERASRRHPGAEALHAAMRAAMRASRSR